MTVPIRKVIAVSGTYGDLLTLECRHVISIEPNGEPPKQHECWQCKQAQGKPYRPESTLRSSRA